MSTPSDPNGNKNEKDLGESRATSRARDVQGEIPREPAINEYVRGQGTLVAVEDRTPPPPIRTKDWIFEEITARVELRFGDEVLTSMGTTWDFHGKESSVASAIKDAQQYAKKRGISAKSELEVVVVKIVSQVRKRPKSRANFYDERFLSFKTLDNGCRYDLPSDVETIAWSSRQAQSVGRGNESSDGSE